MTTSSGGWLVLYVPGGQKLYSSLEEVLGYRCRYEHDQLIGELQAAEFEVELVKDFNRSSVPWCGKILKHRRFSWLQLRSSILVCRSFVTAIGFSPWKGLGLLAVARRLDIAAPPP